MGGPSGSDKAQQREISKEEVAIAGQQNARADKLFNMTAPGLQQAEDFYSALASGDPFKIAALMAPATEQINQQSAAAKERIESEMPRGGEQRLAQENVDISKASAVGRNATQAYLSAFPALSSLAGTGIGLSVNQVATAISALSGGSQATNSVMQADASGKASTMGFLGSFTNAAATAFAA